jgi:adenosylcobinamide kinase/adenosylcobinamide-phosphate guanylyltransferase
LGFILRPAFPREAVASMGLRHPSQLRGSAGFEPASRAPDVPRIDTPRGVRGQPALRNRARIMYAEGAMKRISLITGGARSGKSSHAIALAKSFKGNRFFFIATGQALDIEMATRIEHHKATRPAHFVTIEEALDPTIALAALEARADGVILDCLTLWVSNLMGIGAQDESILASADRLAAALARASFPSIIVTDEVGAGIVPDNPTGRRFRDLLGWTNQKIATVANDVILMVSGYPMRVK